MCLPYAVCRVVSRLVTCCHMHCLQNLDCTIHGAGRDAAARASMLAINAATADAMLGTPDSDLWHNDMDNLLHNVNDLMRRLEPSEAEAGSEDADQEEGDGVFFTHEPGGAAAPVVSATSTYTQTQVHLGFDHNCAYNYSTAYADIFPAHCTQCRLAFT